MTAFLVGISLGGASGGSSSPAAVSSAPAHQAPVEEARPAPAGTVTNGVYEIGADVEPGKYRSSGAEESSFQLCYVDVQRGGAYLLQEVVPDGQVRITLEQSWKGSNLKISGCQPFMKDS